MAQEAVFNVARGRVMRERGEALGVGSGRCSTWQKVSWNKSSRAGEPQKPFATGVTSGTSVTAARQTGKADRKEQR